MLDRRKVVAAILAAMTCPASDVLSQPAIASRAFLGPPAGDISRNEPPRLVNVRQCRGHLARSGRLVLPDPTPGIGREVAGDGMAAAGFGCPGDGGGTRLSDPAAAAVDPR